VIEYQELLGHQFEFGVQDCYTVVRDFYRINFSIELPNYARPQGFWTQGMDMYMDRYFRNGFEPLHCHPSQYQIGDVFIMSIRANVGNHAGVLVENGQLLHHFTGRLSEVTPYRDLWRNTTVAVLRHKEAVIDQMVVKGDLLDYLSPNVRRRVDAALRDQNLPS